MSTADRIAETALSLFNQKGYASTTLTEVARAVGISQGNLTYHFATKLDLALHLSDIVRRESEHRRATLQIGDVADDYVESVLNAMNMTWRFSFLMRDRGIFEPVDTVAPPSPILTAAMRERRELIGRLADEGLLRSDANDLDMLARSLWILSRHWIDHLREIETKHDIEWIDMQRGAQHHLAMLAPVLTANGRRRVNAAFDAALTTSQPNRSPSTS